MNFLLDTCVLSELVKPAPHQGVLAFLEARPEATLFLSVVTLGELYKGIAKLEAGERRERLETWVEVDLGLRFHGRILPLDLEVLKQWGTLQARAELRGRPMPVLDGLIAATAVCRGCTVVTRNGADLAESGCMILNPWEP